MRCRPVLVSTLVALAAGGLLVVAPAVAQETSGPPGGRESAPPVAPTAGVVDPTAEPGSSVVPTAVLDQVTGSRSADAASERDVRRIVVTLLAIAAVMALTTIGFWWATKPVEPELDRLARMGTRGFRRARPYERTEMLGASPLARLERLRVGEPSAPSSPRAAEPAVASGYTAAAARRAPADEPDPSVVEPDPAIALERPVLQAPPPDPSSDAPLDLVSDPQADSPPDGHAPDESGPERQASAGPVTN